METFLGEEHTFEEYVEMILGLKETGVNIPLKMEHVITIGMYDMHRPELIKALCSAEEQLREMLLERMSKDYQFKCKT